MKLISAFACVFLTYSLCLPSNTVKADDGQGACATCKSWCPNDYQCKPLPKCPPAVCFGLTDDYQCKPLPKCPCVPNYLSCDDYKCKPLPKCPSLCFPLWYTCGPTQTGCQAGRSACQAK